VRRLMSFLPLNNMEDPPLQDGGDHPARQQTSVGIAKGSVRTAKGGDVTEEAAKPDSVTADEATARRR